MTAKYKTEGADEHVDFTFDYRLFWEVNAFVNIKFYVHPFSEPLILTLTQIKERKKTWSSIDCNCASNLQQLKSSLFSFN